MKDDMRIEYLAIRNAMDNRARIEYDKSICKYLASSDVYKNSDTILMYYPVRNEVDVLPLYSRAVSDRKRVFFPKCYADDMCMRFFSVSDLSDMEEGTYGIPEPDDKNDAFDNEGDIMIMVPGVVFDKCGYRIGYGKGYYDRFLVDHSGVAVGLAYSCQIAEKIPADINDKAVEMIVTEKGLCRIES